METNQEHFLKSEHRRRERGNALIYVLIAIVLFAGLSFTLARQTDTGEAGSLSEDRAELYATQMISYAAQAKSVIDQMMFSGSDIGALDFTLPNAPGFNAGSPIQKVFHPEGGGLTPGRLPEEAISQKDTDPVAGWYLGRFNNVEWTKTTGDDVILIAYQIAPQVCAAINEKITGKPDIPVLGDSIKELFISQTSYLTGTNVDLLTDPDETPLCEDCHKKAGLCVKDNALAVYGFYTILADR